MTSMIHDELVRSAEAAVVNEKTDLSAALRHMVNHAERSDVTFLCNDGKSVHASRFLVSSRCAVLESMLSNGMLETKLSEIKLPQVSSHVLLAVMEYLYSAELVDYAPLNWRTGFEIISAAQFFILPNLEITVRGFLSTKATKAVNGSKKDNVMEMLSIALEFQESWEAKDTMLETLVDSLGDDWCDEKYPQSLSEDAVHYILSKAEKDFSTESPGPEGQEGQEAQYLNEYLLFRQIVLWQAYQKVPVSDGLTRKRIQNALPYDEDPTILWSLLLPVGAAVSPLKLTSGEVKSMISSSDDSVSVLKSLLEDDASTKSLKRLLVHIKWTRIPVFLLVKIIEPLKLIPSSDLFEILAFHAFRRPMHFKSPECNWKHGVALKSEFGQIIKKATNEVGSAVASNPMLRSYGMYEWHYIIKEDSHHFMELGFVHGCDNRPLQDDELKFEGRLADESRASVLLMNSDGKTYMNRKGHDGMTKWEGLNVQPELNVPVRFQFVVPEHTCWLRIGESFEEAWTGLPDAIYYPAVSFGTSLYGSVQLKLVRGFDYL